MNEKIPASEFAAARGIPESAVLYRIKSGIYDGIEEDGKWFIRSSSWVDSAPAQVERAPEPVLHLPTKTKKVSRYTSRAYVYSIMILLGGFVLFDLISLVFSGEAESVRGTGLRIGVVVLLWTQHKWARLSVQVWAGFAVFSGAFGLFWLLSADPTEYTVAWWGPLFFGTMLIVGLGYLLTAHRFIKVEEIPV
jgi:hypothetical protein